ncbi:hypothetical protein DUNSADRAFT_15713 [Dunaliella salina]|uniref:Uncharacterized protein n=1 Tax=Dunaliella salina TaxID=3046 RepID=A0ABQ7G4W8_DUNSA|nr:hypothetical protein DUNSADRAFT_15713 [Dunaliella salina]|eukprot:KAF5829629.1 hypothetical protein DUNSADRAFT_15713 [Dunaliella salina]
MEEDGDALLEVTLQRADLVIQSCTVTKGQVHAALLATELDNLRRVLAILTGAGACISLPANKDDAPEAQLAASATITKAMELFKSGQQLSISAEASSPPSQQQKVADVHINEEKLKQKDVATDEAIAGLALDTAAAQHQPPGDNTRASNLKHLALEVVQCAWPSVKPILAYVATTCALPPDIAGAIDVAVLEDYVAEAHDTIALHAMMLWQLGNYEGALSTATECVTLLQEHAVPVSPSIGRALCVDLAGMLVDLGRPAVQSASSAAAGPPDLHAAPPKASGGACGAHGANVGGGRQPFQLHGGPPGLHAALQVLVLPSKSICCPAALQAYLMPLHALKGGTCGSHGAGVAEGC